MYSKKTEIQGKKREKIALVTGLRTKKDVIKY